MARPDGTTTKGLRALVLDEDPAALRALTWSLEGRFFSVCTAPDGTRGLDLLLTALLSLDVLVIGDALPGRDALAFAELIRRAGGERDLALVVVASAPAPQRRLALLAAGVDAVVERSEGSDAVALTALAVIASRAATSLEREGAPPPADAPAGRESEAELELESATAGFELPSARGWSMLPA
jgi:CheY-like chemotaxis protein